MRSSEDVIWARIIVRAKNGESIADAAKGAAMLATFMNETVGLRFYDTEFYICPGEPHTVIVERFFKKYPPKYDH